MPAPLLSTIGVPADQQHCDERTYIGYRRQQRHRSGGESGGSLQDGREPDDESVDAGASHEVDEGEQEYIALPKCFPNCVGTQSGLSLSLTFQFACNPFAFFFREPCCLTRPVG